MTKFIKLSSQSDLEKEIGRITENLKLGQKHRKDLEIHLNFIKNELPSMYYAHSMRVGIRAYKLAEVNDEPLKNAVLLFEGGLLHDIGKASIQNSILCKCPAEFKEEDREKIEYHTNTGWLLLGGDFPEAAEIALKHHYYQPENYPELKNHCSPKTQFNGKLEEYAKTISILDCYDAMLNRTSINHCMHRPRPLEKKEARKEIIRLYKEDSDILEIISTLYKKGILE